MIGKDFASHPIANRREHPRILILDDKSGFAARVRGDIELPGTVKVVTDLQEVDQAEWDALVTNGDYQNVNFSAHVESVMSGSQIICISSKCYLRAGTELRNAGPGNRSPSRIVRGSEVASDAPGLEAKS